MDVVYRSTVYGMLEFIYHKERISKEPLGRRILDCGAGGGRPSIGLFAEYGFEAFGIDIAESQIEAAKEFCEEHDLTVNLSVADMRDLPFDDNYFDHVYEFYSMVHHTKRDTLKTIREMKRVVKKGGHLFFGFASRESWPITGEERENDEFWLFEHGDDEVVHTFFPENEIKNYLEGLEVLRIDKQVRTDSWWWARLSKQEWMDYYADNFTEYTREEWEKMYERRTEQNYTHIFYICRKP